MGRIANGHRMSPGNQQLHEITNKRVVVSLAA